MNQQYHYYKAFGLIFQSCIEHPDFFAEPASSDPDCRINFGVVPQNLSNPEVTGGAYQSQGSRFLLKVNNVGRYLVENGKSITIEKDPGVATREIIVFLWASAIAVLMHQRGIVIVHGSAVKRGDHAVIFSGPSGSGKSTIASAFVTKKNAMIISDDISAISMDPSGIPIVLPGYPLMKLWRDSSEKLGFEWDDTKLIRKSVNKMVVNIQERFVQHAVPLQQLYLLAYKNSGPAEITEVSGFKKLDLFLGKIFRKNYLKREQSGTADIFTDASRIVSGIRICILQRQHGMTHLDETMEMIEQDLYQQGITNIVE